MRIDIKVPNYFCDDCPIKDKIAEKAFEDFFNQD